MSFLRHRRSIVRWVLGREQIILLLRPRPSHRLDESQPDFPRRVALLHCPPPLQRVSSSRQPVGTVKLLRRRVGEFSNGIMRNFQPVLTLKQSKFLESHSALVHSSPPRRVRTLGSREVGSGGLPLVGTGDVGFDNPFLRGGGPKESSSAQIHVGAHRIPQDSWRLKDFGELIRLGSIVGPAMRRQ